MTSSRYGIVELVLNLSAPSITKAFAFHPLDIQRLRGSLGGKAACSQVHECAQLLQSGMFEVERLKWLVSAIVLENWETLVGTLLPLVY